MALVIRDIEAGDFAQWTRLWTAYLDFYETKLDDEIKRVGFERLLDPSNKLNGRIAQLDGAPVGLVHFIFHDHMWRPEGVCYLQDLYADPQARGSGVGRALIEAVYEAADQAGIPGVYWLTQDSNKTARRLYDRIAKLSPFIRYDRP